MSASGALPHAALVLVDLETAEGITGRSYLFAFGQWALQPIVGCLAHMRELLKGDRVAPFDLEAKLRGRLTLLDTPGIVGLALEAWRRFRRHHLALTGAFVLSAIALVLVIGPLVWRTPIDEIDFRAKLRAPPAS